MSKALILTALNIIFKIWKRVFKIVLNNKILSVYILKDKTVWGKKI